MKILVFSNTFYPIVGGMESNTETLIHALQELGHTVTLITSTPLNGKPELDVSYNIIRNKSLSSIKSALQNKELLIINGDISIPACLMSYLCRVPYIIIHQMAGKIIPGNKRSFGYFQHLLLSPLRNFLSKQSIYDLGVSEACINSKELGTKSKGVLYNPISREISSYAQDLHSLDQKKYDILFAGRVIDGKGVNVLMDALALLDAKQYPLNVIISGEGVEKDKIKKKAEQFEYVKVKFQDFVKGKDLALTYAQSKIMILASTTHKEGSPVSIVEAFAFGVPVIVSNQPVMLELIAEEAGLSHTAGNAEDLSEKIEVALTEPRYTVLSNAAKARSHKFTYNIYCSELNEFLKVVQPLMRTDNLTVRH